MAEILSITDHRPWPLPATPHAMTQRWRNLLFAHWPVAPAEIAYLLPPGLVVDTFAGDAWVGVVPFQMDQIRFRRFGGVPGATQFAELNLRTYVRELHTNIPGVYFFSLDAANPVAVVVARRRFHLPYYWARMHVAEAQAGWDYRSRRLYPDGGANFHVRYRSLVDPAATKKPRQISKAGSVEHFLTERYCLFTADRLGRILRGDIHHTPWQLEPAEAEFLVNDLPQAHDIFLPDTPPLLHFSRELSVYIWPLSVCNTPR
jgi:uncharacterized protein YqjF (DUF2071 family)